MKKKYVVLLVILAVLIGLRLALSFVAKNHINSQLNNIEGYHAQVENVSFQLYRGGFQIEGLRIIEEASADTSVPMVNLPLLDFSIQWQALLKGRFVGEVTMDAPELNLTRLRDEAEEAGTEYRIAFIEEVKELNPIELNRFEALGARISYRDPQSDPPIHIAMEEVHVLARNLSNVEDPGIALPASLSVNATVFEKGKIGLDARLNLLKPIPDFDVNVEIERVPVVAFSNWSKARANLPLSDGQIFFYAEVVGEDGELTGYVKPMVENLTIEMDEDGNVFEKVYQTVAEAASNLFEDDDKEQIATRVSISGTIDNTDTNHWQAIFNLLRNAFIEAYSREIEHVLEFGESDIDKSK